MYVGSGSPTGYGALGHLAVLVIVGCSLLAFTVCIGVLPRHRRPDAPLPPMCRHNPYNIAFYPELLTPTGRRYWRGIFLSFLMLIATTMFGVWWYGSV
jgi:hypothetical protein